MSALIVPLSVVRGAVDQSARLGMPETRQTVVARVLGDVREGFHRYRARPTDLERLQRVGAAPAQAAQR